MNKVKMYDNGALEDSIIKGRIVTVNMRRVNTHTIRATSDELRNQRHVTGTDKVDCLSTVARAHRYNYWCHNCF